MFVSSGAGASKDLSIHALPLPLRPIAAIFGLLTLEKERSGDFLVKMIKKTVTHFKCRGDHVPSSEIAFFLKSIEEKMCGGVVSDRLWTYFLDEQPFKEALRSYDQMSRLIAGSIQVKFTNIINELLVIVDEKKFRGANETLTGISRFIAIEHLAVFAELVEMGLDPRYGEIFESAVDLKLDGRDNINRIRMYGKALLGIAYQIEVLLDRVFNATSLLHPLNEPICAKILMLSTETVVVRNPKSSAAKKLAAKRNERLASEEIELAREAGNIPGKKSALADLESARKLAAQMVGVENAARYFDLLLDLRDLVKTIILSDEVIFNNLEMKCRSELKRELSSSAKSDLPLPVSDTVEVTCKEEGDEECRATVVKVKEISRVAFLSGLVREIRMSKGVEESYINAKAHLENLTCLLENLKVTIRPLDLFTIITQVTQVMEQMLITVTRHSLKDDDIRTHSFAYLLVRNKSPSISIEDRELLLELDLVEFASRQMQNFSKLHFVKYLRAFELLNECVKQFLDPDSGDRETLKNGVLDFVKTYISLFNRLHRPLGDSRTVDIRIIDGFFSSFSSARGLSGGASASAGAGAGPSATGGAGFALGELEMYEDFFTPINEDLGARPPSPFLTNLFVQIGLLKIELSRFDPKLMNFRLARGTVLCYQFLENVCAYILNDSKIARYNHDFKRMPLPEMGLTEEDWAFLELGKQGMGEARYKEFRREGGALTSADKGASRARGGGASASGKALGESGVVRSKAARIAEDKLLEVYTLTRQIAVKMLRASVGGAGGAGGAGREPGS